MNFFANKAVACAAILSLMPGLLLTARAASSYETEANLIYTIDSIENVDNTGSLAGLNITGEFSPGIGPINNGLGGTSNQVIIDDSDPDPDVFNYTLGIDGDTGAGPDGFSNVGLNAFANLVLENTGTDEYDIQVSLTYALMSKVFGDKADASAFLEYSGRPPKRGQNIVTDDIFAEIGSVVDDSSSGSDVFRINLSGVGEATILARMDVNGLAGTVVNNVPEPNILLMLLGSVLIGFPVLRKRKVIGRLSA